MTVLAATVRLQGIPLGSLLGPDLYDTDTIVKRNEGLPDGNGEVSIDLVALSLASVEPIHMNGSQYHVGILGGSFFNRPSAEPGRMQISNNAGSGGLFHSELPVNAVIRLQEVGNPFNFMLQPFQDTLLADGVWNDFPGSQYPHAQQFQAGGFYPGVEIDPETHQSVKVLTEEESLLARHGVLPAMKVQKWQQSPQHRRGENVPSDVDWRKVMQNPTNAVDPNWIVADDFRSDGRPIVDVIWWGSYFDPEDQPRRNPNNGEYVATAEDGFVLSFFNDDPVDPENPNRDFSRPRDLLGTYVAPVDAVKITRTDMIGWDGHPLWEYQLDLRDTHLEHPSELSDPDAFLEREGEIYWLSIAAEVGHKIQVVDGNWDFVDSGKPIRDEHFWGWHTSPDSFNDDPTMGHLLMPDQEWNYRDWSEVELRHNILKGDANNDLVVTGADLISVQQHFAIVYANGDCDGLGLGDANDDCVVSGADLIAIQQNFARIIRQMDMAFKLIPPSSATLGGTIPEPSTVALLALGALAMWRRR